MNSRELKKLTATAIHEAGHAIASVHLGHRFRYVSIIPNDDYLGVVVHRGVPKWVADQTRPRHQIEGWFNDRVFIALAGPRAERRFLGRSNYVGASSDTSWIADIILRMALPESAHKPYFDYQRARVDGFLSAPLHWRKVEALANAILDRRKLVWDEVQEIVWRRPVGD